MDRDNMNPFFSQPRSAGMGSNMGHNSDLMTSAQQRYAQMENSIQQRQQAADKINEKLRIHQDQNNSMLNNKNAMPMENQMAMMPDMQNAAAQAAAMADEAMTNQESMMGNDVNGQSRWMPSPKLQGIPETSLEMLQYSLQETLLRNIGEFVVLEFLIGTQKMVYKQGILYNVGENYVTLYEEKTKTFVMCDSLSIKFVTFYLPGQRPAEQQ